MYEIDKQKTKEILVSELGYKSFQVDKLLENYPTIHDPLAGAVQQWLEDRTILDVAVEGMTIEFVMHNRRCNFILAVEKLNRLLDEDLMPDQRQRLVQYLMQPVEYL